MKSASIGSRFALSIAFGAITLSAASPAFATLPGALHLLDLRRQGVWPDADKLVTIDVAGAARSEAVRKVAEAAGWSVVVQAPPSDPVDLHVKNQPAVKVLEMLLSDGDYIAQRTGTLVSIQRLALGASAPSAVAEVAPSAPLPMIPALPPVPPVPPALGVPPIPPVPPMPPAAMGEKSEKSEKPAPAHLRRGDDRTISGGNLTIGKDEVVRDVTVFGGNLDVYGTVTGDIAVLGGAACIHPGAHVVGDAATVGGTLKIEDGSEIEGDVAVVGGVLDRNDEKHTDVGVVVEDGKEKKAHAGKLRVSIDDDDDADDDGEPAHARAGGFTNLASSVLHAITRKALLFVFGCVLLALATGRMEKLQGETAARPMRSFGLGVAALLAGTVLLAAMAVTVIGIPFALAAAVIGAFAAYAGVCAVLTTAGGALAGHRTKNPYAHLAIGCALMLVVGSIPYLGTVMTLAVVMIGIGVVVATNGAGIVTRAREGREPYRAG